MTRLGQLRLKARRAFALLASGLGMLSVQSATSDVDIRRDMTVAAIERVMPSVVNIATTRLVGRDPYERWLEQFFGRSGKKDVEEQPSSVGSGVIIDQFGDEGYILTNLHVVGGANRIQVQLMDGRVYDAEKMLGTQLKDLALLRIVRKPDEPGFVPIRFAQDDDLLLGETVITVGNPFGLGGSVSRGILSSKNRRSGPNEDGRLGYEDWLQTDADINPGNSGGPLVNLRGELIGLNVAVYNEGEGKGTGFSIPVKQISSGLSDFFSLEFFSKLHFGARIRGTTTPLTVREIQPNSPAYQAGLRVGQQIVEVNGKPVKSLVEFCKLVASKPDLTANITAVDNGGRRTLQAQLVTIPELDRRLLIKRVGLTVQPLTEAQATNLQIKKLEDGLLVTEVEKDSPAEQAQFQPGMVLTHVDGLAVGDQVNLANVLGNKKTGERIQLTVIVSRRLKNGYTSLQQLAVTLTAR